MKILYLIFVLTFVSCSTVQDSKKLETNFKEECLEKNLVSCELLATLHERNENIKAAKILYKYACDLDSRSSCFKLGELILNEGKASDALPYYVSACEKGFSMGCVRKHYVQHNIRNLKYLGDKDLKKCSEGDPVACRKLGYFYSGAGEFSRSKSYFSKACDGNLLDSCSELAYVEYVLGDFEAAYSHYDHACKKGFQEACDLITTIKKPTSP